jgi:hypothetical protein
VHTSHAEPATDAKVSKVDACSVSASIGGDIRRLSPPVVLEPNFRTRSVKMRMKYYLGPPLIPIVEVLVRIGGLVE